ncbi:MAG: ABC transporter permease [Thermomicrobiales bacterium]
MGSTFRSLAAMTAANLKMSVRNRTALFWNLAFPALFIVIFGAVLNRGLQVEFHVGLVEPLTPYGERVAAAMAGNEAFTVTRGAEADQLAALAEGDRDVVLLFPPDQPGQPPTVTLYDTPSASPTAVVAVGAVRELLISASGGALPVTIDEQHGASDDISFMDAFLPGIIAMSLMNSGIIGLSTAFVNYRERGILRRIKVTPFPLTSFILARILSQVIMAVMQSLVLLAIATIFFGFHWRGNPLQVLIALIVGALAFLAIGFAISGISPNAETAASYANLLTFPMLFLSGIFFSLENAPAWLRPITKILPLPYLVDALRGLMTHGRGLAAIWPDLLVLLAFFALSMIVAVRFFRWDARPS